MANVLQILPELEGEEMSYVQGMLAPMSEDQARHFASIYRSRRREPMLVLVLTLLGFVGFAGIHRFILGQIGMGLLYFFTGGLCLIGTIVDLVNNRRLSFEYNRQRAEEIAAILGVPRPMPAAPTYPQPPV